MWIYPKEGKLMGNVPAKIMEIQNGQSNCDLWGIYGTRNVNPRFMIRWTVPLCRHFPTSKLYQIITLRGCRPIHIINQPAGVHSCRSLTCRRLPSFTRAATTLSSTKVSLVPSLPHQYQMTEGQNCLSGQDPAASVFSLSMQSCMCLHSVCEMDIPYWHGPEKSKQQLVSS